MNYLLVQADKPWCNYYILRCIGSPPYFPLFSQRHRRRKVLNIGGGGGGKVQHILCVCGGGGGKWGKGGKGGKLFPGCKLIGAPAPNQCQIITFLTLKTDNIAKLRI